jgi:hypothetical protein
LAGGPIASSGTKGIVLRAAADGARSQEVTFDVKKLLRGKAPDVTLQANDLVVIPDSQGRRYMDTGVTAALSTFMYGAVGALLWR